MDVAVEQESTAHRLARMPMVHAERCAIEVYHGTPVIHQQIQEEHFAVRREPGWRWGGRSRHAASIIS